MDFKCLTRIDRGRLYGDTPGVVAATPYNFSLHLSKGQITVLQNCCRFLQQGVEPSASPWHAGQVCCKACKTAIYPLQDNKHMLLWRSLETSTVDLWLQEYSLLDELTMVMTRVDLVEDLQNWLRKRAFYPRFVPAFA